MANVFRGSGTTTPTELLRGWSEDYARGRYTAVAESWRAARAQLPAALLAADLRAVEAVGWSLTLTKQWDSFALFRTDMQPFLSEVALATQMGILETWRLALHEARYDASIQGARKLQAALMETTSPRLLAQALKVESVALLRMGRYFEAENLTRRAADLFRLSGDTLNLAHCATNLGLILNARGEIRAARDELRNAVVTLVEAGAAEERVALVRVNLAVTEVHLGNEKSARLLYETALEVFERFGLQSEQVTALNGLGHCARLRGQLRQAHDYFTAALERTDDSMPRQAGLCREFLGQIDFDAGRFASAEDHYRAALEIAAAIAPDGDLMVEASWRYAELLAVVSRSDEAREHLARAEALCLRNHDQRERGCVERVRARVLLAEGDIEAARRAFTVAAVSLANTGRLFEAALTKLALIVAETELGDLHRAAAELRALEPFLAENLLEATGLVAQVEGAQARLTARFPATTAGERYGFVTGDPELLQMLDDLPDLAATPHPVLLEGESGTGKELVARALHALAGASGEFVAVNCAAIPHDLFESELFGHARGAYSGAGGEKPGLLEQANGGTLLLDEIGDMPLELQVKLLRFLDDGVMRRLGEIRERRVRVKIVAATNQPLRRSVAERSFRGDLFHRLAVHHLEIKPLRQRPGDVERLVRHLLQQEQLVERLPLTPELLAELDARTWPGNVRELRNELIRRAHQSPRLPAAQVTPAGESTLRASQRLHERRRIAAAVEAHAGNLAATARELGMHVTTLRRKMRSLRIERSS